MLRKFFVFVILTLILSTTFIKNHTKKIREEKKKNKSKYELFK